MYKQVTLEKGLVIRLIIRLGRSVNCEEMNQGKFFMGCDSWMSEWVNTAQKVRGFNKDSAKIHFKNLKHLSNREQFTIKSS